MSEFLFKTRHNSNPKGKPRVYFTCHAEDFDSCFGKIADDILALQDCAIYYLDDMAASIEADDLETTLGYMSLFVVPITSKLLTTPNRALEHDIPYAQSAMIPVLPIVMAADNALNNLYDKCKLLKGCQYLVRTSNDSTEKSYKDKLSAYLENVLVGDELAARVRSAFDAYIFLSYRKKDRRYANELMKRIHEIPEFRNIAIWYDEFLTPGEDFHENIAQALKSCALFTLVVTPNVLEEPNFVADTEYPMAMEAVMCVIPAEMEKTDRDALAAKFRDIPECINPNDPERLTQQILESLPFTQVVHINEAEQNFLMGIAYLKGIDVEIDRKRGIALITAAAEAGHTEAIEKLYNLYSGEEGSGYKSQHKAIPWGEKLVEIREKEWGLEHPNTLILIAKLAASYSEAGNSNRAKDLLEYVHQARCCTLGENHPHTATVLHNLAVEYAALKQPEKAVEIGEKAYALRCDILGETHPDTLVTLHNLGSANMEIGNTKTGLEQLEKAYTQSQSALGETHPTTIRILSHLAQAFHQYGDSGKAIRLLEAAHPSYVKELGETCPDTISLICNLGKIYIHSGNLEAACRYLDPLIETCAREYGPESPYVTWLIQTFDDPGFMAFTHNEFDKAALYWGKAYDLNCRYLGANHETTQSIFNQLVTLLPEVTGTLQAAILERIYDILMQLRNQVQFGSFHGTTVDGLKQMLQLLRLYRTCGTKQKRIELLEMYWDLCAACCPPDTPIFEKLEEMLTEDRSLPD